MNSSKRVYLDYAAATPLDPQILQVMQPFLEDRFANPSCLYSEGRAAKQALEQARKTVAQQLGARAGEIVFTASGTEAINLAIQGVTKALPEGIVLAASTEHQAVLANISALGERGKLFPVKKNGRVNRDQLVKAISDQVVLICLAQVNSELGTIQPLSDVAALVEEIRRDRLKRRVSRPLYLLSDSSAAAGQVSLQVSRLGVDLMALNGAKLYGPKGSAALYIKSGVQIAPVLLGGGQERGLRSGSEAVAQAVGLAKALEVAEALRPAEQKRLARLKVLLLKELAAIQGLVINNTQHVVPNILNFRIEGQSGEDLLYRLDAAGFAVATGAACSAAADGPSHVLLALGLSPGQANSSLRISLGRSTTGAQLTALAAALKGLVQ
jgi:cysteine desulfurase